MKRIFTFLLGTLAFSSVYSQTTVYTTGQTYSDPWTGWSTPVTTNVSASSVNASDIYTFNLNGSGNNYSLEISRMFTINSNDIDIYLSATAGASGTNATVSVEYSEDNSSWTEIGSLGFSAFGSQTLIIPTFASGPTNFYLKAKLVGVVGSPSSANFNNFRIDADLATESVSVSPSTTQNILTSANGAVLTATEATAAATSREWKFSSTSGSGYTSFASTETGATYTPNFASVGTYYVVCESNFSGNMLVSNEVQINVSLTSGVEELTATNQLLYFNNLLSIVMTANDYEVSIYSISGQLILRENDLMTYDFSNLEKGVYIVNTISRTGEKMTIKVSNF